MTTTKDLIDNITTARDELKIAQRAVTARYRATLKSLQAWRAADGVMSGPVWARYAETYEATVQLQVHLQDLRGELEVAVLAARDALVRLRKSDQLFRKLERSEAALKKVEALNNRRTAASEHATETKPNPTTR